MKPSKEFRYGAVRLTVRSRGPAGAERPTHQYLPLAERFITEPDLKKRF